MPVPWYLVTQGHTHKRKPTNQTSKHSSQLSSPHHLSTHRLLPDVSLVPEEVCLSVQSLYLVTQGHTHKKHTQPTNQMSKHSSQLSSPHHLSTRRLLPDVSLVPEEVCLHGALGWNRPHLTSPSLSDDPALPTGYSTWHTNENERHTQEAITCKLPRNCDANITPEPLNMAAVCLILRARTQPNPGVASQFMSRCCDEMMDVGRCVSMEPW